MVACKFYQAGNCRYGQSCRFDHINNFGRQGNDKYGENKSISLGVAEEILIAERGNQWPLSCFGPFKEQPCIPGFEDISPEEVRWEMYQAEKNNTVEQAKQQFHQLCQDAMSKRNVLKNPTIETAKMLEKLHKGTSDPQQPSNNVLRGTLFPSSGIFSSQNSSSPFTTRNFTPTTTSLFSSTATSTPSIFGTSNFSGTQSGGSMFGGATQQTFSQPAPSVFSSNNSGSIFGVPGTGTANNYGTNTNLFTSSAAQSPGIFTTTLGATNTLANPLFGQKNTPAFGGAPVFGGTASNFGNNVVPGLFNKPQASVFTNNNNNPPANTFGTAVPTFAPNTASNFGNNFFSSANTAPFNSGSSFGTGSTSGTSTTGAATGTKTTPSNPFALSGQPFVNNPFGTVAVPGTANIDPYCYSPPEALTDEEKSYFAADKFILGRIPLKPPSVEIR
ncbi:GSCOCG00007349001-RA-CDS [Cotesia congregata]|nr:GSCOCG00007349001-RA-CDS [Cotesia congregata]